MTTKHLQSQNKTIYNNSQIFNNQIWMNSKEAALYLRTSIGSLRNMVYRKQLSAKKLGNRLRFKKSELDFMLENSDRI